MPGGRAPDRPHGGGEPVRDPDAASVLREVMAVDADDEATLAVVRAPLPPPTVGSPSPVRGAIAFAPLAG